MLAPEVFLGRPQSCACDVWAAGVVMYELFARVHPYGEFQRARQTVDLERERTFQRLARCFSPNPGFGQRFLALAALVTSDYTVAYGQFVVPGARAVVEAMLAHKDRATCAELLEQPLFREWLPNQEEAFAKPSGRLRRLSCLLGRKPDPEPEFTAPRGATTSERAQERPHSAR